MGGSPHRSNSGSRPASSHSGSSQGRSLNRILSSGHNRRQSAFANFSTMSETSLPWTTKDIGFNAISGVLNDPGKRNVQPPKARKAEIPPVSHASIPKVKSSDFDSYINYISNVYQRYHQNKMQATEEAPNISSTDTQFSTLPPLLENGQDKSNESIPEVGRNPYGIPNVMSLENLEDLELSPNLQSQEYEMPMLENVPSIFFEPNFQLENPRTFDAVCEGADIVGFSGPNPPTSTNSILQEKLSHYLDTVEVHLIQEISKRSAQFFEALSNLQALHQETLDCVSQIHTIRQGMKETQKQQCESGLKVVSLQRRRTNIGLLYNGIQMVKEIRSSQPTIQILLNQGDFFAALDLIDDAKSKLSGSVPKLDMQAVRALLNFSSQLDEMYVTVGSIMEHDFISSLISDFTMYIDGSYGSIRSPPTLEAAHSKDFDSLKDRIAPATMGLVRSKQVKRSLQLYRDRLLNELKTSITKQYPLPFADTPEGNEQDTASSKEARGLSKQLKTMPFDNFFKTLLAIYAVIIAAIERTIGYHSILKELFEDAENHGIVVNDLIQDANSTIFAVADMGHVRCAKLVGARADQNAQLNPTDFYRFFDATWSFINSSEKMCGRTSFGLRGAIISQTKAFINNFHMERTKQEALLIENEQWSSTEVPQDFQDIIGRISAVAGAKDVDKNMIKLDGMTVDIMQKMIELLKVFNSRVCQVILGAGAMRSAGLKNISARHLALASQSVGIMITLIPLLKECVRRCMAEKQVVLLSEFDRILKDYQNHQGEIHTKLVAIMNERFDVHMKSMQAMNWDAPNRNTKSPSAYMETLVKETTTLHKVLNKYLPPHDLKVNYFCCELTRLAVLANTAFHITRLSWTRFFHLLLVN
ncbi:Vps54-like protein-domain-containing protein [Umbelopsis sp. PMI_123]|nr:Vps54-like protein-domain-containing protein [Umbelopsis sp. PMI_123]